MVCRRVIPEAKIWWQPCLGLQWTSSHQCTSSGWGCSSRFGDEPKTHPLPLPQNFTLAPTSPPSYLPHLISHSLRLQSSGELPSLSSTELLGDINTRLEGGELNVQGMWRGESKRSTSSQMQKRKKKDKLPPFSAFFFFFMVFFSFVFFFFSFIWKEVSSLPSLHFFLSLWFFFYLCFSFHLFEKKKMSRERAWNERAKARGQK